MNQPSYCCCKVLAMVERMAEREEAQKSSKRSLQMATLWCIYRRRGTAESPESDWIGGARGMWRGHLGDSGERGIQIVLGQV